MEGPDKWIYPEILQADRCGEKSGVRVKRFLFERIVLVSEDFLMKKVGKSQQQNLGLIPRNYSEFLSEISKISG